MEGYRKNLIDDHLSHMKIVDVELADAVIPIMDLCGTEIAVKEKLKYNSERSYHKLETD